MTTEETIGPYRFLQAEKGHRVTSDSFLLVDFLLPLKKDDTVIDLGTGTGAIPLTLCWKTDVARVVGVELGEKPSSVARENVKSNGLTGRIEVLSRDWRTLKEDYEEGTFSVVVSNPPYIKEGHGRISPVEERALARYEEAGTLVELVEISKYLAGTDGRIFYVYPVKRFFELLNEFNKVGLKARRLRFVHTGKGRAAKLFLVEAGHSRTGGTLEIEEPVFIG